MGTYITHGVTRYNTGYYKFCLPSVAIMQNRPIAIEEEDYKFYDIQDINKLCLYTEDLSALYSATTHGVGNEE